MSNYRASKYMKQKLIYIKEKMDKSTVTAKKKVKTALPVINGTSKQNQWIYSCIWQPTPVLLPGKSQGRSLVGYSPWGRKDSDTTERLHFIELNDAIKHQGLIKISRTLPQDSIIHFFFSKCTQNIYQDRLYPGS